MTNRIFLCLFIVVCGVVAFAQKPSKPWVEWSDKEVKKMLDDSPWGRSQIETNTSEMFFRPDGVGASGPTTSSQRTAIGQTNQATSVNYRVRFLSARPIREAFARQVLLAQKSAEPELVSQLKSFVERDFSDYIVVAVTYDTKDPRFANVPNQAFAGALTATLKSTTYLDRNDGKRLFLADYRPPTADGMGAKFIFPKKVDGNPFLTSDFSNVRFYSEIGKQVKLDVRFKVSDMYYNGQLEY
ncbi:MAG TPA: hypothetical protein VLA93_14080 [Pyrinomonadaceae bacterium]|nr:hypothetical protein [Pyrinomonadaceae bacterium]